MAAEEYVKIIVEDDLNRIAWEDTIIHEADYIRRDYEIDDGTVIQYEWRSFPGKNADDDFNHKFTMTILPKKNPDKLKLGVVRVIPFPANSR